MARFEVYPNPIAEQRPRIPFWLDVQSDLVDLLATRVVIPLRMGGESVPERLNPRFEIAGKRVIAETQSLVAVPLHVLKKPVGTLKNHQAEIEDALDFLFRGY